MTAQRITPVASFFAFVALSMGCSDCSDCSSSDSETEAENQRSAQAATHFIVADNNLGLEPCPRQSGAGIGDGQVPDLPSTSSEPTFFGAMVVDGSEYADGTGTYAVSCQIAGTSSYQISVEMEGANVSPLAENAQGTVSLELSGSLDESGKGVGTVSVWSPASGATYVPDGACTLSAVAEDGGGFGFEVGRARLTFVCPETLLVLDDLGRCELRGTLSVSDCAQ